MKKLKEDVPANSAGAGNVAGIGVGNSGEPGINKRNGWQPFIKFIKRKKLDSK